MIDKLDQGKFIVINRKRFDELKALGVGGEVAVAKIVTALSYFHKDYEKYTGNTLDQKYIVCNQDEPYAEEVASIILKGEELKDGR